VIFYFKDFVLTQLFCALFLQVQQLEFSWTFIQTYSALMHRAWSESLHNTSTSVQKEIFIGMTMYSKPRVYQLH